MAHTIDTRITGYEPLLAPAALLDELPLSEQAAGPSWTDPTTACW